MRQETIAIRPLQNCLHILGGGGGGGTYKKGITPVMSFGLGPRQIAENCSKWLKCRPYICLKVEQLLFRRHDDRGRALIASFLSFIMYRHTYKIDVFISRVNQKVMYISLSLSLCMVWLCRHSHFCDCALKLITWWKLLQIPIYRIKISIQYKNIAIISIRLFVSICISSNGTSWRQLWTNCM